MTNVIVSGGISGLYAAYELSKNNDASKISIYEKTPRLGRTCLYKEKRLNV